MSQFHSSACFTIRKVYSVSLIPQHGSHILPEGKMAHEARTRLHLLDLFFNPLFALLILFLECDILDFGTASTIGGSSSSSDAKPGIDRYQGADVIADLRMGVEDRGSDDRRKDWIRGKKGVAVRDEEAIRDRAVIVRVGWSACDDIRVMGVCMRSRCEMISEWIGRGAFRGTVKIRGGCPDCEQWSKGNISNCATVDMIYAYADVYAWLHVDKHPCYVSRRHDIRLIPQKPDRTLIPPNPLYYALFHLLLFLLKHRP